MICNVKAISFSRHWCQAPFFKQLSIPFLDYTCMRNPRFLVPGKIHFITFRTEEGLPFVPLRFMNMLIRSTLARANQHWYRATIR